jgi:hypothetical protein
MGRESGALRQKGLQLRQVLAGMPGARRRLLVLGVVWLASGVGRCAADSWDVSTLAADVFQPYSISIDAKNGRAATISETLSSPPGFSILVLDLNAQPIARHNLVG